MSGKVKKYKVLKDCRISGYECKPGDILELPGKLTPARAEVNVANGNLGEMGHSERAVGDGGK